jgi:hypothetical protein
MMRVIRRRRWVIAATTVSALLVAALVMTATHFPITSDRLRAKVVATLAGRLDSDVELRALSMRLYPRLHAAGEGLVIRHKGRTDVPPLITIDRFDVDADLVGLWRRHIAKVTLTGLNIQIPPGDDNDAADDDQRIVSLEGDPTEHVTDDESYAKQLVIDELVAPDSQLTILRRDPTKIPKTWYLHKLKMNTVGMATAMPFEAWLTNAVPPGEIDTHGHFGPWSRRAPGRTPLDGAFTFDNANLSVFRGISGILSAKGTYGGSLQRIEVDGETHTPDFMVNLSGHEVPLDATYHAIVDGTNGNTTLDPVNAKFLDTSLVARGGVYDVKDVKGRDVILDITMENGRLQDVMRLAVRAPKAPMTGTLHLQTKFFLPPGNQDVVEKLELDGRFAIVGGRFTDPGVQARINELSGRASAKPVNNDDPDGAKPQAVTSDFTGRFKLGHGVLALPSVTFDVPGAVVEMGGRYALVPETIDFSGNLFMDAKISETMRGWKSIALKVVDPLFRKNGKTVIPLKVSGNRADPHFGLDMKRAMKRDTPEAPKSVGTGGKKKQATP